MQAFTRIVWLCFLITVVKANGEIEDGYRIKKSSLCAVIEKETFCTGEFNFAQLVEEQLRETELSKENKNVAKNSGACADALKKAMCSSSPSPLCLEDKPDNETGAERVCREVKRSCPLMSESTCVSYMKREVTDMTCKDTKLGDFGGICPKPTKKMPASYLRLYEMKSEKLEDPVELLRKVNKASGNKLFSQHCMRTIENTLCIPAYCSDDEKTITLPNLQTKCKNRMKCVSQVFDSIKSDTFSSLLKPLQRYLTGSCDMLVQALTAEEKQASRSVGAMIYPQLVLMLFSLLLRFLWH